MDLPILHEDCAADVLRDCGRLLAWAMLLRDMPQDAVEDAAPDLLRDIIDRIVGNRPSDTPITGHDLLYILAAVAKHTSQLIEGTNE